MSVRLTSLCDNTASFGFLAEWGLAILIEVDGSKVLFDTGMSTIAAHNARRLGVDLSELDAIVLSHGHIDHTGGLKDALAMAGPTEVVAHPDIWFQKYKTSEGRIGSPNGIPFSREELESWGASFALGTSPMEVGPGIVTSGEIPMLCQQETVDTRRRRRTEEGLETDALTDELALAILTPQGLIVVLGCGHRGPINTIRRLQEVTGEERVHTIVGGTHLAEASTDRIEWTLSELGALGPSTVACAHCTGFKAASMIAAAFGDDFVDLCAGSRLVL